MIIFHHLKPTHVDMDPKPTLDPATEAKILKAPIPDMAKQDILELATSVPTVRLQTSASQPDAEQGDRLLRAFDEL